MALAKHVELVEKQEKQREKNEKEKVKDVKDVKAKENEMNEMNELNEKEKVKENGNEKEKNKENQKKDAFEVKELHAPKEGVPSASPREVVFSMETPREPQRATKKVNRKAFQAGTPSGGHDRLGWMDSVRVD